MGDPPNPPARKPWVAVFIMRLCLIAWPCAALTELLPPSGFESMCLLFGSQAAALALLTCVVSLVRFRQGVFFVLLLAAIPPFGFFAVVLSAMMKSAQY
jgi:hypothetical protein